MAYTNGNLALQPKKKPEQKPAIKQNKRVVVKRKTITMQEKLLYLFTVIACVLVAGVIIFRYAEIYKMSVEIKHVTSEYEAVNVELKELKKQVEMLSDPEFIRKMAESQGMVNNYQPGITVNTGKEESATAMGE
ncbi:cell division initiation protein [Paenibacillus sp. BIHB 4019]|uniref:Cell division initiation protein n=1 Tax=Paenibacillus sp. BIHB 4019 TaxID=1870819 RepID=A0A1B2DQI1_9BACL|nr:MULTISPECIES: cell division initiation protein [unclassified Paenibacillus]ANY69957.1 cell division initiation protein [Paenibacillus sp. BIHB 4019]KQN97643.1 cell division initiation protein [Paenibacillus sp. Leaf72]